MGVRMHTSPVTVTMTVLAIGLVFLLERVPGGSPAVAWLYVVPVTMIALWSSPRDTSVVVLIAGAATLFSLIDFSISSIGETHCTGILSRLLVIGAIWLTATLSVMRKKKERTTQWIGLFPANP